MPVDYWVPATQILPPEQSQQVSLGAVHTTKNGLFEFTIEGYYKKMHQLIEFSEGESSLGGVGDWQDRIDGKGNGLSKGLECLVQKKKGKLNGWIGYTLSNANRTFVQQNNGKSFPYKYDRRHDVSIVAMYRIKPNIDFSATWVYASGSPYTLAVAAYQSVYDDDNGQNPVDWTLNTSLIYSDKNAYRMRNYHRLDIGVNFHKEKKWGERVWNVSIYNAYNRQNPYYYYWKRPSSNNSNSTIAPSLHQKSIFPFIPSVSYSFKF
jgi:hypothetical protein